MFFITDTATVPVEPKWPVFTSEVKCVHMSRCLVYGRSNASSGSALDDCPKGVFIVIMIIINTFMFEYNYLQNIWEVHLLIPTFACDHGPPFDPVCCGYLVLGRVNFLCLNLGLR